jgi:hypothetical protein
MKLKQQYNLPKKKVQDQTDSLLNATRSYQRINTNIFKLYHEIEREGTLPKSFYEDSITLIPNQTITGQSL